MIKKDKGIEGFKELGISLSESTKESVSKVLDGLVELINGYGEDTSKTSPEGAEGTQKVSNGEDDKTYTVELEPFAEDCEDLEEQLNNGYLSSQPAEEEPPASKHYQTGIDPIAYGEVNLSSERMAGFYQMNVLKYVTRYQRKNGVEDLQKAKFYLDKLIELENQ